MKISKRLVAAVMLVALMFTMTACGGSKNKVTGTYSFESITEGDQTYTAQQLKDLYAASGQEINIDSMFSLEMKSDKTFTLKSDDKTTTGTYTVDGDKVAMTAENTTINATYSDGKLTLSDDGMTMVFKKK